MRTYNEEAARQFKEKHKGKAQKVTKCNECYENKIIVVNIQDRQYCNQCWEIKRIEFLKKTEV